MHETHDELSQERLMLALSSGQGRVDVSAVAGEPSTETVRLQIERVFRLAPGGAGNVQGILPLSALQEGMLFQHMMDPDGDRYVLSLLFEISARSKVDAFIRAVQTVLDRHGALRTAIVWSGLLRPLQIIYRSVPLPVEEISAATSDAAREQLRSRMASHRPAFDLTKAPLVRLLLAANGDGVYYGLLQVHHIICDFRSWELLVAQTITGLEGQVGHLSTVSVSYSDHLMQTAERAETASAKSFFRAKLADVDEPTAPFGILEAPQGQRGVLEAQRTMDRDLAQRIRNGAKRSRVSVARLFHAAWALVVARTSGRDDVVFGTVVSTRRSSDEHEASLVGLFVNTLPLRLRLAGLTALQLVEHTHRELAALIEHRDTPLIAAQHSSGVDATGPLFTTVINYRRSAAGFVVGAAGADGVRLIERRGVRTNYPITIAVDERPEDFLLTVQSDARIDPQRVLSYVTTATVSLVDALMQSLPAQACLLPIVPESERSRIVDHFNDTREDYPRGVVIQQLFEWQVARSPAAIAVSHGDRQLTYDQLNRHANRLANELIARGVRPEDRVGLCVERDLELVIGLLGIVKSGAAYVALDSAYPIERLQHMIHDSAPVAIVVGEKLRGELPVTDIPLLVVGADGPMGARLDVNPDPRSLGLDPANLVSVIYTSGSTGQPKGVMVEHAGLCNLAFMQQQTLAVRPDSRVLQFASLSFDACTWECVMALCGGASLHLASREEIAPGEPLQRLLVERKITHVTLPPVALAALASHEDIRLTTLVVAGEACPAALAQQWSRGRCFINAYGPTEATVCASMHRYTPEDGDKLPIGRPIPNARIYIFDRHGQPVPIGVAGEIYVGGEGVANGYLGQPELTAQRFLPDPFAARHGRRMYRTGDLGVWRDDGTIQFLGRNDFQVKIRGFRIELGEVESQLARQAEVRECIVVARETPGGDKQLVAYVTLREDGAAGVLELRNHLKAVLPAYMVPSAFVILPSLPLTPNGKIDRRALPAPSGDSYARSKYERPRGAVEEKLVHLWQELLQVAQVGRRDNFFELGGHSLLAIESLLSINQAFGQVLRVSDIYRYPTLHELAARIEGREILEEAVDLAGEVVLAADIVAHPARPRAKVANILLTGATGFVGRFLLAQLLTDTDATLWCLVRADSARHASSRLRTTLEKWSLWNDMFESRIVPIAGDITQPRFGLEEATWSRLALSIDTIYHCAASMNHLETYAMAKPGNVAAMSEVLTLATHSVPKVVNHVSTLSVFRPAQGDVERVVSEDTSIKAERHSPLQGYVASKWVAERLALQACDIGIPINFFRVGLAWADAQAGRYDESQQGDMIFRTCLLSGLGIELYHHQMPPTPVDHIASAMVALGERYRAGGGVFHLSAANQLADGLFERCNQVAGTTLRLLPHYEWIREMKKLHSAGWALPALPLIDFAFGMDERAFHELQRRRAATVIRFDCTRTCDELDRAGITMPGLDDRLLKLYVTRVLSEKGEPLSITDRRRAAPAQ